MNTAPCRGIGCTATIGWIKTTAGQMMPCDLPAVEMELKLGAASGAGKRVTLITEDGETLAGQVPDVGQVGTQVRGFRPHFASCVAAQAWKKAVRRPQPKEA